MTCIDCLKGSLSIKSLSNKHAGMRNIWTLSNYWDLPNLAIFLKVFATLGYIWGGATPVETVLYVIHMNIALCIFSFLFVANC